MKHVKNNTSQITDFKFITNIYSFSVNHSERTTFSKYHQKVTSTFL